MYLVQLLLPLYDNDGHSFPRSQLNRVKDLLAQRFGGITMFRRSPAEGLSKAGGAMTRDEIVVFEIMTKTLDRQWWHRYRKQLEKRFRQDCIVVRSTAIEVL